MAARKTRNGIPWRLRRGESILSAARAIDTSLVKARLDRFDRAHQDYTKAQEITRLLCAGAVEVQDGDRWARGDRADFDNVAGVLEVTSGQGSRSGIHVRSDLIPPDLLHGPTSLPIGEISGVLEARRRRCEGVTICGDPAAERAGTRRP